MSKKNRDPALRNQINCMFCKLCKFLFCRLIHGGQLLNGLAGPTVMSAGPLLSTTWFAPDQRATATAVASLVGYLGAACSFLIGPLAVPAPNDTEIVNSNVHWDPGHIRKKIEFVLYTGTLLFIEHIPKNVQKCFHTMWSLLGNQSQAKWFMMSHQIPKSNIWPKIDFTSL